MKPCRHDLYFRLYTADSIVAHASPTVEYWLLPHVVDWSYDSELVRLRAQRMMGKEPAWYPCFSSRRVLR